MRRLENKVCVVTGAAGGIGLAAAERLTREGAVVEGIDLLEHGVGSLALERDLTDEDAVRDAFCPHPGPARPHRRALQQRRPQ